MRAINALSIGNKLRMGFGLLVILMLVLAAFGLARMRTIADAVEHQQQVSHDKLEPLFIAREALGQTGIAARNAYIFSDEAHARQELAILEEQRALYLVQLEKLDGVLYDNPQYLKVKSGMLAMAKELARPRQFRESGKMEAFGTFLVKECSPLRRSIVVEIDTLVINVQQELARARERAADVYQESIRLLLGLTAFAAALGVLVSWLITQNLRGQLGGEPVYAARVANSIAEGDLTMAVQIRDSDRVSLLYAIKLMRDSLASIVGNVRNATATIADRSRQMASGNHDLSVRTEQQASTLEEVASAMQELTMTVRHNAENAQRASVLAGSASDVSAEGGKVVSEVILTMESIRAASGKVVDIISVIDSIAFQTNILALNAAVEAARAGEQGRGFAVVASEVRSLAQRSAAAAKEIKELIDDSVEQVESGSLLVEQAGLTMQKVVASIGQVTGIMAEISSASAEQANGIAQVNRSIEEMDAATQKNAALVEDAATSAHEMQEEAAMLAGLVGVFKLEIQVPSSPRAVQDARAVSRSGQLVCVPSR